MTSLNDVSTDDLRQVLAKIEGKKPTQRVMAAINYFEEDEATLEDVAERYGYTAGWLSRWLDRLERLAAGANTSNSSRNSKERCSNNASVSVSTALKNESTEGSSCRVAELIPPQRSPCSFMCCSFYQYFRGLIIKIGG